ncbi:MAG: hypothetical protein ACFCVK_25405 [Acidimicrobiales bacterium]
MTDLGRCGDQRCDGQRLVFATTNSMAEISSYQRPLMTARSDRLAPGVEAGRRGRSGGPHHR